MAKEERERLPKNFNIVKEERDFAYLANKRIEYSKFWTNKLLKASFYLSVYTLVICLLGYAFILLKPSPDYYASTDKGIVYKLTKLNKRR